MHNRGFMKNARWVLLTGLMTCSSFAGVNFQTKKMRVDSLMKLQSMAPAIAFEAYQRELTYEQQNLSVEARAKRETNLLADMIRSQVAKAYKAALDKHESPEIAREEVRGAIESDLELAQPEMKEELMGLANKTLDSLENGATSEEVELENVELALRKEVENRKSFLNQQPYDSGSHKSVEGVIDDADKKEFTNKAELLESLTSERESSRWVSSSSQTVKTAEMTMTDSKISLQVKVSFLGATIEAGPNISFRRIFNTNATILAEGMSPVILNSGNFDTWKRDRAGKIVVKNGKQQSRYVAVFCDADLNFETDYAGSGGFSYMGVGGSARVSKKFTNTVNITSRRIALPDYVGNESVTVKYISEICHKDFLNARFSNALTVRGSLELMMKNVVAGLTFSHPKTKCAVDEHCYNWFNKEVISLVKIKNFPRCKEESDREKFYSCQLRGLEGQNCPVYENGKRTSDGQWEYACDTGLKCVKYEDQTFFLGNVWNYAKGKCQVVNKKTYRNPFDVANDKREIEVELEIR
jgi:hypothetical protein